MRSLDYFLIASKYIRQNKSRTILNIIGVSISLILITSLLILGSSLSYSINELLGGFGTNTIMVTVESDNIVSSGLTRGLDKDDCNFFNRRNEIKDCIYMLYSMASIDFQGSSGRGYVAGTNDVFYEYMLDGGEFGFSIDSGKDPSSDSEVVIGSMIADGMFDKKVEIGDVIEFSDDEYRVVGIAEEIGSPEDDSTLWVSEEASEKIFDNTDRVNSIMLLANSKPTEEMIADLDHDFEEHKEGDFDFLTMENIQEIAGDVLNTVNYAVLAIALISLFVGSIGISNTLFTSVNERTKDIGIMKSLGARNEDIFNLFLSETIIMTFISYLIGVGIGSAIAYGGIQVINEMGLSLTFVFEPYYALGLLIFSMVFGIVSSLLPARKAVKLDPIDAMRY
ncbi:MAG: ABC transporter permease [Candidatus Woesearchaeota archaeon]